MHPPLKKVAPIFSSNPSLKVEVLSSPPPPAERGEGGGGREGECAHYSVCLIFTKTGQSMKVHKIKSYKIICFFFLYRQQRHFWKTVGHLWWDFFVRLGNLVISWFLLIESLKMTCARSHPWLLNFLSKGEGLDCLLQPNDLPKLSKNKLLGSIVTCPKSVKQLSIIFELFKGYLCYKTILCHKVALDV